MKRFDLVAFDVDGTLIRGPEGMTVWEVLNKRFTGVPEVNRERWALYRQGKLSYAEWVALDVGGWKDHGARRSDLIDAFAPLELVAGTREGLSELKESGLRLFAISGTLDLMLETIFPDHPFEEVHCNHIGFDEEGLISHWKATPFDMHGKAELLRGIAMREEIPLARCAFVGDSGNDQWIAREAGFAVAFNSNSRELDEAADVSVRSSDLRDVLPHLLAAHT